MKYILTSALNNYECDDVQAYAGYEVTTGNTSYKISLEYGIQLTSDHRYSTSHNSYTERYVSVSLGTSYKDAASYNILDSGWKKDATYLSGSGSYYHLTGTTSKTISRTHSAQTVYIKSWGKYLTTGTNVTNYTSTTIPALDSWKVTFDKNGGSGTFGELTKWRGESLRIHDGKPTKTGYDFKRWKSSRTDENVYFQPKEYTTYDGAQTLTAEWTPKTYTLTYDANGGTCSTSSKSVTYDSAYGTLATPTRTGYDFDGWYTTKTGGTQVTSSIKCTGDATIYAHWTANTYSITYFSQRGASVDSQTKTYGVSLTLSTRPANVSSEWTFLGWNTSSTATTALYDAGGTYTANKSATLYGVWKRDFQITYNANNGTGAPSTQTITIYNTAEYASNVTLSSTAPTRTNYQFMGWGTSASATTTTYAAGATISTLSADKNLYAIWSSTYVPPKVVAGSVQVYRTNSDGTEQGSGTYGYIKFKWTPAEIGGSHAETTASVKYRQQGTSGNYIDLSTRQTSNSIKTYSFSDIFGSESGNNKLNADNQYDVIITLTPSTPGYDVVTETNFISSEAFTMDINPLGTGVAFFGVMPDDVTGVKTYSSVANQANLKNIIESTIAPSANTASNYPEGTLWIKYTT